MHYELPTPGTLVADKYRIEALLGHGGMGAVFRARHELMDKLVALKLLHAEFSYDADSRERFLREARAAARIRHPNVVQVFDVGLHQGALFMVMELLEGQSFEAALAEGSLPVPRALGLLVGAMRGVAEAHEHGIIHRDIKPENIFIVHDTRHVEGVAKVLDFGISKLVDDAGRVTQLTQPGEVLGTPEYMSYEHMAGARDLDARSDVYSFGVLLYRALTGISPFDADSVAAIAVRVATHRPLGPKQLRPELPSVLDKVVMKAMAFERGDRYPSMQALIDALTHVASTEGYLQALTHPSALAPRLSAGAATPQPKQAVATAAAGGIETQDLPVPTPTPAAPTPVPTKPSAGPAAPTRRHYLPAAALSTALVLAGALGLLLARVNPSKAPPPPDRPEARLHASGQGPGPAPVSALAQSVEGAAVGPEGASLADAGAGAASPSADAESDWAARSVEARGPTRERNNKPAGATLTQPAKRQALSAKPAATGSAPSHVGPPTSTPPTPAPNSIPEQRSNARSGRMRTSDF